MPFIIQPPDNHETSQKLAVIVRDQNEQEMLQDLHNWGWKITGLDFSNEQFMEALNYIDKTANKQSRRTPYTANQTQYPTERPTLLQIWRKEGKKKFQPRPWPHQIPDEQPIPAPIEEPIPKHIIEAEKQWLKSIDRTRQTNGLLDYNDPLLQVPRLLTAGLDHTPDKADAAHEPAHTVYAKEAEFQGICGLLRLCRKREKRMLRVETSEKVGEGVGRVKRALRESVKVRPAREGRGEGRR